MASVTVMFHEVDEAQAFKMEDLDNVENLQGPTANFNYWTITIRQDDEKLTKIFYDQSIIRGIRVAGEEELIQKARLQNGAVRKAEVPSMQHQYRDPADY